ncbi:pyruvate dehydrogenase (acetyl-transferring) E1 component subunit alpha, partial [bacterium]|nr:pyruvate dehydrogenase (acetyl-transferring) E1 component subunit alpha [candidate division CSSED10-310 bacterium]
MPVHTIHESRTFRLEILDKAGKADQDLLPELSDAEFIKLYESMILMRKFDEKALNLQRQGRIGTYGSLRGQEAAQAGLALVLDEQDWVVPSFREHGVMMSIGIPPHLIYAYWKGDERGNRIPDGIRCLPPAVPVGSQLIHATGLGLALRLKQEHAIAVGFAGDGATSEGDFHEALNSAGVFRSQTIFFIQNNGWAISVPFNRQTAAASIAQKAHAYGIPGIQVDGNDVLAVYAASKQAKDHVLAGKGPYLIEALTYRMGDHTTADDQSRYRSKDEVKYWEERDPILRMREFLIAKKIWSEN